MLRSAFGACGGALLQGGAHGASSMSQQHGVSCRLLSVLSWGRNVEGQCGVETSSVIVSRPTPVLELLGSPVESLVCGKLNSGCVVSSSGHEGEAWTWGCGKAGKLGHGSGDAVHEPYRVESLVSRASVVGLALGDHHSLFLDANGGIWSCGENKEGQCGLGTPLEVIASQHRKAFYESARPAGMLGGVVGGSPSTSLGSAPGTLQHSVSVGGGSASGIAPRARDQRVSQYLKTLMQHDPVHHTQHRAGMQAMMQGRPSLGRRLGGVGRGAGGGEGMGGDGAAWMVGVGSVLSALDWGGFDTPGQLTASGAQPGQLVTPMRIARDQHPLSSLLHRLGPDADASLAATLASGLESRRVVETSASRYFSLAVTSCGEVWTFGACYNGALGSGASWSTSAQQVSGALASVIADNGGATRVAAGGTFCVALTATGKVVVWGKVPGGAESASAAAAAAAGRGLGGLVWASAGGSLFGGGDGGLVDMLSGAVGGGVGGGASSSTAGGRVAVGEIPGLPPIRHIAAGASHALLSDGERVWAMGKMLDASGREAESAPWYAPKEMMHLPADGVAQLACGAHASAVVSVDGQLYMWGRLLEYHHAEALIRRHAHHAGSREPLSSVMVPEDVQWKWAGFGADRPTLVDGLSGVRKVALGGWHALVQVD
ncbi:hypothetical protein FOA52_008144 [Chlamydomonas sp. UWO 241]|nr:hypothetical protein FOA52_008144 [Chlamydomonas sp. UWO 241]